MGSIRLGVGAEWLFDGRAYRVIRQLGPDRFVALDRAFNLERTFSEEELLTSYADGRLKFARQGESSTGTEPAVDRPRALGDLEPNERAELQRRWQAIEPLTRLSRPPERAEFNQRALELAETERAYSSRTLARFYTAWSRSGDDRTALVRRTARCGGRGRIRANGFLGRYPAIRQLVDEAIGNVFLTMARRPIAAVTRRVLEEIERQNSRLPAGQALIVPREGVLQRAISRRISQLDPWEVDRARWGRRIADRRHQATSRQQLATRILERVEIDHCLLKVVVGNESGPIGQPWLTILIDYYSRMITGFCLGFEPPSYGVIMEALRTAILPKTELKARYPRLQNEWPCFGVPEKIVCDRGSDLTSNDFEQAAFQLGITLDFAPPRTPHFKGTVESFFDTLNDGLLSSMPGRTFRNWERRADYQPDDGPLMPYESLLEIIHIHLQDVYAQSRHPTAGKKRIEVWQESAAEFPPCLPATPDDLIILLAKRVERCLSARGIEVGGMFYLSDELMAMRAELASNNLSAEQLQVRYNPWDLGHVWVLNPLDKRYLRASAVDEAMRGMTQYQWRVLKCAIRERFDEPTHLLSLAASRNAIRDVVEAAVRKPSRKRRIRATRFLHDVAASPAVPDADDANDWVPVIPILDGAPSADHGALRDPAEANPPPDLPPEPPQPVVDLDDWEVACE